jgi:predicted enzyme related to lactoylglutathione lyase
MQGQQEYRPGQPRWVELFSTGVDAATAFYTDLFGWTAETAEGGYTTFSRDGRQVAGLMAHEDGGAVRDAWSVDLHVADARATAAAATAHGGTVHEIVDLGTEGMWVSLTDPTGAHVGAWQNGTREGIGRSREAGRPIWEELVTRDFDAAVSFYRDVFGWQTTVLSDTDEFRYITLGEGDDAVTGIEDGARSLPEIEPSHWVVYFGVENANQTAVRITELGGTVLGQVEDSPYGRLAPAADPTGATFSIMQVHA